MILRIPTFSLKAPLAVHGGHLGRSPHGPWPSSCHRISGNASPSSMDDVIKLSCTVAGLCEGRTRCKARPDQDLQRRGYLP